MLLRGFQKPFRLNHAKNASIFVAAFGCEGFDVDDVEKIEQARDILSKADFREYK